MAKTFKGTDAQEQEQQVGRFQLDLSRVNGRVVFDGDREVLEFEVATTPMNFHEVLLILEGQGVEEPERWTDKLFGMIQDDRIGRFLGRACRRVG